MKYAFMRAHRDRFRLFSMCRVLKVKRSGYYAWLASPLSTRSKEDQRITGLIKHAWLESGGIYGYRKVHDDLRELGEMVGKHRVARLMKLEGLKAQIGYGRRPRYRGGQPSVVAPNRLDRQFNVPDPTRTGSPTSLTSGPMKVGFISRWSLISSRGRWLGGRRDQRCTAIS